MNTKTNYEVLFTENQISEKVRQLGLQITKDYENKNLLLVCMLKGSILFFSDLIRSIDLNFHIDFMAATSYVGTQSTGVVTIEKDLETKINKFVSENDIEIIDVKYQVSVSMFGEEQIYCFSAMLMYK